MPRRCKFVNRSRGLKPAARRRPRVCRSTSLFIIVFDQSVFVSSGRGASCAKGAMRLGHRADDLLFLGSWRSQQWWSLISIPTCHPASSRCLLSRRHAQHDDAGAALASLVAYCRRFDSDDREHARMLTEEGQPLPQATLHGGRRHRGCDPAFAVASAECSSR